MLLRDAEPSRSANPGLARCVLRRRCHSGKLRNVRTRERPVTGHGRARLETQSERLSSFISIVTGHETNIVAYGTLDRVSQHVQCRWRAARTESRRTAPGHNDVIDVDLRQSMAHVSARVRCRARAQQLECRPSSTNEHGVGCGWHSHGSARLRATTTWFYRQQSAFLSRTSMQSEKNAPSRGQNRRNSVRAGRDGSGRDGTARDGRVSGQ